MPVLCPRVFILLLLPLIALSCSSTKSHEKIVEDYKTIIEQDLDNAKKNIENLLNKTCSGSKPKPRCSSKNNLVTNLFNITCKMKNLSLNQTSTVIEHVEDSVECSCTDQSTKRIVTMPRNERHKHNKHKRILCRAKALLSSLAKCYQLLSTETPTGADTEG